MNKQSESQSGFGVIEALLLLVIVGILGFTGWFVYHANLKTTNTLNASNSDTQSTTIKPVTHTSQEALSLTQTTYDTYLAALAKANTDPTRTQPVAQVGLNAIKANLAADLYSRAAAVTQATPFSCTAQYVADKYTASLTSSNKADAIIAVAISNGGGISTTGMSVKVDLATLKLTSVSCPS